MGSCLLAMTLFLKGVWYEPGRRLTALKASPFKVFALQTW